MYHILIIEDEPDIQEILKNYLTAEGYAVTLASDGVSGISEFHRQPFDLILLDLMLPKIDGFGVCELIRKESDVPIIMLTALDEESCQIRGFDLKADDYVTKPFSMPILLRKIAAILRRTGKGEETEQLRYKELCLDLAGHHVYLCGDAELIQQSHPEKLNGQLTYRESESTKSKINYLRVQGTRREIELTQKEFELLHVLLLNQGIVLTRQKLLNLVWGEDYFGEERIVDTHIKNLRKKLEQNYISTIRGVGYRIDKEH